MLEDRLREEDGPEPEAEEPPAGPVFNPLVVIGGLAIAGIAGVLAVSGLLLPAIVLGGAFGVFLLVQVVMFRVFPPPKG